MSDAIGSYNKGRWEELAKARVEFSRPWLELDAQSARQLLDTYDIMGDVTDKMVLALGAGGGQQSAAFALLGAVVTVMEISETQLERDRQALAHYGLQARLEQGDMRDLSRFDDTASTRSGMPGQSILCPIQRPCLMKWAACCVPVGCIGFPGPILSAARLMKPTGRAKAT